MAVEVKKNSRLLFADLVTSEGIEFWDTVVLPDARPRVDDIQHIVSSNDRIDLLAHRYYGDSRLWWVIAWANNLEILPTDMKQNAQLRIPSKAFVEGELLLRARRNS
jgi:nucleoid-associated protein YgaU